jgi:hypothetical protein
MMSKRESVSLAGSVCNMHLMEHFYFYCFSTLALIVFPPPIHTHTHTHTHTHNTLLCVPLSHWPSRCR